MLSVIWGLAFVAIRVLDRELSFINLTLIRWFIASAGFLAVIPFLGAPKAQFDKADLPRILVIGFLNVAGYHLSLNYGEITVSAGLSGLLITLGPVFSAILATIFLKEKMGKALVLGLLLALGGAVILSAGDLSAKANQYGPIAVILAALSFAIFGVLSKPLVSKYGGLRIAVWAGLAGTVMLLPILPRSFITDISSLSVEGWGAMLYLSLLSSVIGYSVFYTLVGRGGISRIMIQLYLAPAFGVLGGILLLGETLTLETLLGGGMILLAVWIATTRRT